MSCEHVLIQSMYALECEESQVEEQRQGYAGNLYPSKKLLRWLKQKPTYDTTLDDNDEFTNKGLS